MEAKTSRERRDEEDRKAKARSSSGRSRDRNRDRDRDRNAKSKSKASRSGKAPLVPGAVSESGDQNAKSKARARHKGSGATTPGAVAETNSGDARETARRRKEGNSKASKASRSSGKDSEDRNRERRRKIKEKEAMAAVTPLSGSTNRAAAAAASAPPEEVPTASAIDIEEDSGKEETYAVQGSLVAPEAPPVQLRPNSPVPLRSKNNANPDTARPVPAKPFYCKPWFWVAIAIMVIGGAVAVIFLLNKGNSNDNNSNAADGDPMPGTNDILDVTNTTEPSNMPNVGPSVSPSSLPTEFVIRYDPPTPDDCIAVANGEATSQEGSLLQSFQLPLDVVLSEDKDGDETAQELEDAIRGRVLPELMGCDSALNRKLQQLDEEVNYVIANAEVNVQAKRGECVLTEHTPCLPVLVLIDLSLKGPERVSTLIELLNVVFGNGQNLVVKLQLSTPYVEIPDVTIEPTEPTDPPIRTETPIAPPSEPPSSKPTSAPVVGPSPPPSTSPTRMSSISPSGLPSVQASASPTLAPYPGPSPPPTASPTKTPTVFPTPSPTKTATVSPTPSPTGSTTESQTPSPTKTPTESPTPSPTMTPTESPTEIPTTAPTRQPSVVPTLAPTDRPTFAFDGQGVPVYGGWENQLTPPSDVGKYFLFVTSDWETVFGTFPPPSTGPSSQVIQEVEQRRNDEVIFQGPVMVWSVGGLRPEIGIPDGFEHGRRNPISTSSNGNWQTGDIIVPRYVTPNVDWRNSFTSAHLEMQGLYFLFKWEAWEAVFGNDPRPASQQTAAIICRNGQQVRSADVQTFLQGSTEGGYIHGRLVTAVNDDFEAGDYLLPPGMPCPKAIRPAYTPVSITAAPAATSGSVSVGEGRFFHFDNSDWEQAFEFPVWGDCPNVDDCPITGRDRELAYFVVRQCRNGSEIWNGIVATSVNHFVWPSETRATGRRYIDGADGDFQTGDTIVPFSRSCS